jgi:multidrug efflux pump subunit AcrA (membrane-fusion protein)
MPVLQNPRHEKFAQARAKGARLQDAYEDAGFAPDRAHASRMANEVGVAERIAELRAAQVDTTPETMIATLMRLAKASEDLATTAGLREARAALLEARRLAFEVSDGRSWDR